MFGVSTEVSTLGTSLYVLGFALGPLLWAPFSELKGRKTPILISMFGYTVFQAAVATAENLQTIMICRFFGGCFASCPLTVVGAVFSDMFDNKTRGLAITVFSMTVFTGPVCKVSPRSSTSLANWHLVAHGAFHRRFHD